MEHWQENHRREVVMTDIDALVLRDHLLRKVVHALRHTCATNIDKILSLNLSDKVKLQDNFSHSLLSSLCLSLFKHFRHQLKIVRDGQVLRAMLLTLFAVNAVTRLTVG